MKYLDELNPRFARPNKICSISAIVPCLSCVGGAALANGAAPSVPFWWNPIAAVCAIFSILSVILFFVPRVLRWDWKTKYFGVGLLYLASAAFGVVPWLAILLYSRLPLLVRAGLFGLYAILIFGWCYRFVRLYRKIYRNEELRGFVYEEEADAVYYLQKGDGWLLNKKLKFMQFPSITIFVVAWLLAFSLVPFMAQVTALVGLPFTHILLAVGAIPVDMAMLGLATRGWLVFFHYPARIQHFTGKPVYVDMASKPRSA